MIPGSVKALAGLSGAAFFLNFLSVFFLNWIAISNDTSMSATGLSLHVSVSFGMGGSNGYGVVPFISLFGTFFTVTCILMYLTVALFILLIAAVVYTAHKVNQNGIRAADRQFFGAIALAAAAITVLQLTCVILCSANASDAAHLGFGTFGVSISHGSTSSIGFGVYITIVDTFLTLGAAGIAAYIAATQCK